MVQERKGFKGRTKIYEKKWAPKSSYPKIGQLTTKAATLRSMVYWMQIVCSRNATNRHGDVRSLLFTSYVEFDKVCRRAGRHFTREQHEEACKHLEAALVANNSLAAEAIKQKKLLWKLIPKNHAISHVYDTRVNPRRVSCYQDEDMVGRCKRIYIRCHGLTAPKRGLQRYAIVACKRWWAALGKLRGLPP